MARIKEDLECAVAPIPVSKELQSQKGGEGSRVEMGELDFFFFFKVVKIECFPDCGEVAVGGKRQNKDKSI